MPRVSRQIYIYTDGSVYPNGDPSADGGAGGVLLSYKDGSVTAVRELCKYCPQPSTNNIAELTAIKASLKAVKPKARGIQIHLYTDSMYCINVLTGKWRANANRKLINEIQALMRHFPHLRFFHVKGHNGDQHNERADYLANLARTGKLNDTWLLDSPSN